jgi:hypothetical protein
MRLSSISRGPRRRHGAGIVALVSALAAVTASVVFASTQPASATTQHIPAATMLAELGTASAHHAGFTDGKFHHWTDGDNDGCDTRNEVLLTEATVKPHRASGCRLSGGKWVSPYDGKTLTSPGRVHIDFTVPLSEVWASGAWEWSSTTRQRFANDLGLGRVLTAVSGAASTAKGSSGPAGYLPPRKSYDCTYVVSWIAVKWRWQLDVDSAERATLTRLLGKCGPVSITRPTRPLRGFAVPQLPIVHSGDNPGAAVLAGDAPLVDASPIPTDAHRVGDRLRDPACITTLRNVVPHYCAVADTHSPLLKIALIGDSMAEEWEPPLLTIARHHHWKLVMAYHSACQFTSTLTVHWNATAPFESCRTWGSRVLNHLLTVVKPDVVIVGDRPVNGAPTHAPGSSAANTEIGHGMADYWRILLAHHIQVVAMRETPETNPDPGNPTPLATARKTALPSVSPNRVAAGLVPGTHLIDLSDDLCGPHTCHPVEGNVTVYRDSHHLTKTMVNTTAPYLERELLTIHVFADA